MDASQITKLRQLQNTTYINRNQTVDSSTLTWRNQIQHSKYIQGIQTCTGLINTDVPTQLPCINNGQNVVDKVCSFGGQGKSITLSMGSTKRYPNVYAGASGSASHIYSSDKILLQQAGRHLCAGLITEQDTYITLPKCSCIDTNGPTPDNPTPSVNNNSNPYLPALDTYYALKNKPIYPQPDKNLIHFVNQCCS